jgi:hypothetical protein
MWRDFLPLLIVAAAFTAGSWRGKRWLAKHKSDPVPTVPIIAGVSAFTGEIIASGQPNTELGDGKPPETA